MQEAIQIIFTEPIFRLICDHILANLVQRQNVGESPTTSIHDNGSSSPLFRPAALNPSIRSFDRTMKSIVVVLLLALFAAAASAKARSDMASSEAIPLFKDPADAVIPVNTSAKSSAFSWSYSSVTAEASLSSGMELTWFVRIGLPFP